MKHTSPWFSSLSRTDRQLTLGALHCARVTLSESDWEPLAPLLDNLTREHHELSAAAELQKDTDEKPPHPRTDPTPLRLFNAIGALVSGKRDLP